MKKRLLSGLLILVMLLAMLPVSVLADGTDVEAPVAAVTMQNADSHDDTGHTYIDENGNGVCDASGCKYHPIHSDSNSNGTCDYDQCTVHICNDVNAPQYVCDYDSSHILQYACFDEAEPRDYKCDVPGCTLKDHVCGDYNNNGVCDFDGCKTQFAHTHYDENGNHVCDVPGCEEVLSHVHVDTNGNCVCDVTGCKEAAHNDTDNDGLCNGTNCGICLHTKVNGYCTSDCPHALSGLKCCDIAPAVVVDTYTVTAWSGKNGSVTNDGVAVSVAEGSDYTIWFYPKKGYEVSAVYVNGMLVNYDGICYTHHWDCTGCHECDWIDWSEWYDCDYYWCDHDYCWYDYDYCHDCWYDHYYCDYYYAPVYWDDWQDGITLYNVDCNYDVYVTFSASDNGCPSEYYNDLDTDAWYHEATDFVIEKGLMKGVGYKTFDPEGITTRGELITMLYRLAGEPKVSGESEFKDVKDDQWYTDAILWATKKGIVEGHGHDRFGVEDAITREETVTILYRYAKYKGVNVTKLADLDGFVDAEKVSDFAEDPFGWAVKKDIVKGDIAAGGKLKLNPLGNTLRVEMAAMLMRFAKLVG